MLESNQAFQWQGITVDGRRMQGAIKANDMRDAQAELKRMGIEVIKLEVKRPLFPKLVLSAPKQKIKHKDILLFTRYLSTMLSAGLPILQALDIIAHDQENSTMKALVLSIRANVVSGKTLAESFSQYPDYFNDLYVNLIKAGEKSGTLNKILKRLADHFEKTENLKRKVKKALIYPAVIVAIAAIVSLALLIFVIPQFEKMFQSFGVELPMFTRLVVAVSAFLRSYGWIFCLITGGSSLVIKQFWRQSDFLPKLIDKWSLRAPIVGLILKQGIIARFTSTLSTTLDAGMPLVECMKAMAPIMGNRLYTQAVLHICEEVTSGHRLAVSMAGTKLYPNMVVQMVTVGEASGSLAEMLNKVSDYYEDEVNNAVDKLSSLLEPLIMAVLGLVVGGFVVAMYLPIFKIGALF